MLESFRRDPFRLCFPIGLALALQASALWVGYVFLGVGDYPGQSHARLFIGGFLYYFIVGFLMTAIPRFTQTPVATTAEIGLVGAQIAVTLSAWVFGWDAGVWCGLLAGWLLLMRYAVRRFRRRSNDPPPTFLFVGLGILLGLVGYASIVVFHVLPAASALWLAAGKICIYDAMVLSMILGVGGRLVPGILGFDQINPLQISVNNQRPPFLRSIPLTLAALVLAFATSVVLEVWQRPFAAFTLRAAVITIVAVQYWRLHRSPERKTWFTQMIRWSCAMILAGSWIMAATAEDPIAGKHVMYIGGFVLLTLLVGGRVTMSHSGLGASVEERRHPYLTIGAFLVLAAATRASANVFPDAYNSHLGYAAVCVLLAVAVWATSFLAVIVRKRHG